MGARLLFTIQLMLMARGVSVLSEHADCRICDPGFFQKSCSICDQCPNGTYTQKKNMEQHCHPCSLDCRPEFNMEVVEACSPKSDVKCRCKAGYTCKKFDDYSKKCSRCKKDLTPTTVKMNGVSVISFHTVTKTTVRLPCGRGLYFSSSGHCEKHKDCDSIGLKVQTAGNTTHDTTCHSPQSPQPPQPPQSPQSPQSGVAGSQLWLIPLISIGVFAVLILLVLSCCRREDVCLKQLMKSCSPGSDKAAMNEAMPRGPTAAFHIPETHPDSLPAANHSHGPATATGALGPLYIHHPSTVFVSLLNQFGFGGGRGGGSEEEQERAEHGNPKPEGSEVHTPSSPIPLSTEERSREDISVPFQEQGKESHVSKEEEL
ncbi:tumor necrosis factor receptor superfamily member 3 [Clupea harengus]|uniref:Tumor necrosis factor receptor superfamily member 3 n=1 Tax=Clupea harengus TaxID=7950 RepID=A0A6P8G8Z1_CLUHA|nr:tumor necrosis factor receptor superfamily member 3 [Clupea harengus]XP_031432027.1 tumor necrosis factor receptor superfamily member 3 [Clupea harengus]